MEPWAYALIQLGLAILVLGLLSVLGIVITGAFGTTVLPLTAQQLALGLQQLNQINETYTNNSAVQSSVSQAQTTLLNLVSTQYTETAQGVTATGQAFVFLLNVLPMVVILVISVVVIALIFQVVNAVSGPGYRGMPSATM
ncbi:MAG: hypothetical protein NV1_40 [Nanoarchaeotal virus 1]|nr:MAG: hypothetical protein NV1_40 [Nanoarchaeotal virus 1]